MSRPVEASSSHVGPTVARRAAGRAPLLYGCGRGGVRPPPPRGAPLDRWGAFARKAMAVGKRRVWGAPERRGRDRPGRVGPHLRVGNLPRRVVWRAFPRVCGTGGVWPACPCRWWRSPFGTFLAGRTDAGWADCGCARVAAACAPGGGAVVSRPVGPPLRRIRLPSGPTHRPAPPAFPASRLEPKPRLEPQDALCRRPHLGSTARVRRAPRRPARHDVSGLMPLRRSC